MAFIQANPGWWGLAVVSLGAFAEYVVPPLPADSVVLAGSLLVVAGVQTVWTVGLAAVAGGCLGAATAYGLGCLLAHPDGTLRGSGWMGALFGEDSMPRFLALFRTHGYRVILVNRAFPAVRAVTFVAAGASQLDFRRTMLAGMVSQTVWTSLVLGIGVSVGGQWEKIERVFAVYEAVVYAVAVGAAVVFALLWWIRKKRGSSA